MSTTAPRSPRTPEGAPPPWYRLPFVWFVIALFVAILAAAVHLVVVSIEMDDPSVLEPGHERAFKIPVSPDRPEPDSPETP